MSGTTVARRTVANLRDRHASLLAAGVAFFSMLALVPALVAFVAIYGLVANPSRVEDHVGQVFGAAPTEFRALIKSQLQAIINDSKAGASVRTAVALFAALLSSSTGMRHLLAAVSAAYGGGPPTRRFRLRVTSLLLTVGGLVLLVVAFGAVALLPSLVARANLEDTTRLVIGVVRFPLVGVIFVVGVGVVYRVAPVPQGAVRSRLFSAGAIVAGLVWIAASVGFSAYTANFGNYNQIYGSLGAVVVVMLWLYVTAFCVIAGAELNASLAAAREEPAVNSWTP